MKTGLVAIYMTNWIVGCHMCKIRKVLNQTSLFERGVPHSTGNLEDVAAKGKSAGKDQHTKSSDRV